MKRSDVVQQIRSLKNTAHTVNPDPAWVASTRARVLQHIDRTTEEIPTRIFTLSHVWSILSLIIPQKTVYAVVRPAVIFTVCFTLGTAGWITTVTASLESLPGDALYPVKLATEQTQVAVTQAIKGDAASTELRVSFVSRRADEVAKVIAAPAVNDAEREGRVQIAVANLTSEVESVSVKLNEVKNENPEIAIHVAQLIDTKVNAIQLTLEATQQSSSTSSTSATLAIVQLKDDLERVRTDISTSTAAATSTPSAIIVDTTSTTAPIITVTTTPAIISTEPQLPIIDFEPEVDPLKDFPERPKELGPDVVDEVVPIQIKTWE